MLAADVLHNDPRHPDLARFIANHAIRFGDFQLTSERASSYYCDGKQVSFSGEGAALIADAIIEELQGLEFDAVGGMDMGATPIVATLALRLHQMGRGTPTFVVRKQAKEHGTRRRVEGLMPQRPSKVVIVDDVVTTAGSILQSIEAVRDAGHEVVLALAMLDREEGGAERLKAARIAYRPLVRISEIDLDRLREQQAR